MDTVSENHAEVPKATASCTNYTIASSWQAYTHI